MLLTPGVDYTVTSGGVYTFAAGWVGKSLKITYEIQDTGATWQSALAQLGLTLSYGTVAQPVWGYLSTNHPSEALSYSGFVHVDGSAYDLGSDAEVVNHTFEVTTPWEFSSSIFDANPAAVVTDFLCNGRYGAQWAPNRLDTTEYSNYCVASGLFLSPAFVDQRPAAEWLAYLLQLTNSDAKWSGGKLTIVPLGDQSVTANGATFTANTTPVYDLDDDAFIYAANEDPVKIKRKSNADAYNHVRLEYWNRDNQYNFEIVEAKDEAHIEKYGLRTMPTVEAHCICDINVARRVAQLELQRQMTVRNTYEFRLPWKYMGLEQLDLVTLTDADAGLNRTPVRITKIDEEADDGKLTVEAEDCPIGMASAPLYGVLGGSGFAHDFNASPGNALTPTIFELPVELTQTGLELAIATSGASTLWGGATVWVSQDNLHYKAVGKVFPCRFGTLTATLASGSAGTASVSLSGQGGQILSGSSADADALGPTLCWVGTTSSGEFFSFETATLTGTNAYNLTGLHRAQFGNLSPSHASGQSFVRFDSAVARSGPLDLSLIGKTIYIKLTSFNVYGGGEQLLADVSPVTYAITGYQAKLPPPDVSAFSVAVMADGTRKFTVTLAAPIGDGNSIVLKSVSGSSGSWSGMTLLRTIPYAQGQTTYVWETNDPPSGTWTFAAKLVDRFGNESANASFINGSVLGSEPKIWYGTDNLVPNPNSEDGIGAIGMVPAGSGLRYPDSSNAYEGNGYRFISGAAANDTRISAIIPCEQGETFYGAARVKSTNAALEAKIFIRWIDKDGNTISSSEASRSSSSWGLIEINAAAPTNTVSCWLGIKHGSGTSGDGRESRWDNFLFRRQIQTPVLADNAATDVLTNTGSTSTSLTGSGNTGTVFYTAVASLTYVAEFTGDVVVHGSGSMDGTANAGAGNPICITLVMIAEGGTLISGSDYEYPNSESSDNGNYVLGFEVASGSKTEELGFSLVRRFSVVAGTTYNFRLLGRKQLGQTAHITRWHFVAEAVKK